MASVDTSLAPHATGAAGRFAAAHAAPHALRLYGGWFCPFVQRSWIVLHEKRIAHQYIEINPYRKAPEFLALNPRGLVPTLAVPPAAAAGRPAERPPLYESTVICEYLDEAYPGGGDGAAPDLLPTDDAYARARCRLWIDHVGSRVVPAFYRLLQHTPEKPYAIAEAREGLQAALRTLVREMDDRPGAGPWFLGDRFGMVDVILAPWAKRLFLIDHYKPGGVGIPAADGAAGDDEVWARWRRWFAAVVDRPSVKDTWSDDQQYIDAYRRYAEDTTQSLVGQATRKGERMP